MPGQEYKETTRDMSKMYQANTLLDKIYSMSILHKYTFRSAWKASSQTPSSSAGDGRCRESQAQDFVLSLFTCGSALQAQAPPTHTHTQTPQSKHRAPNIPKETTAWQACRPRMCAWEHCSTHLETDLEEKLCQPQKPKEFHVPKPRA